MLETVRAYIEQYNLLPDSGVLVVAVSGGADSLCLLHLVHRLCGEGKPYPRVRLLVAHLNHRLRGLASDQDAAAVARLAESWGLPVTLGVEDVPALALREHLSLEEAARSARYRFLRSVSQGQPIAVAHHRDDQVETLLLHWLRGGGISSMVGLQPRQQDIIRPLLAVTHAETLAYCAEQQLHPLEDASNSDPRFLRNRIRHELLPLLEEMNPGIRATLLRTAEVMQVDAAWIEAQVDACWPDVITAEQDGRVVLRLPALLALPLSLQRHLQRRVTARLCGGQSPLELRHYKLIEQLLERDEMVEQVTLHLPESLHILRRRDTLIFEQSGMQQLEEGENRRAASFEPVVLPVPGSVQLPGTTMIVKVELVQGTLLQTVQEALRRNDGARIWSALSPTPSTVYIDASTIGDTLIVRGRQPGDRIRPLGMAQEKKVQDILVNAHVPREERARIPLVFSQRHCIWLAGLCIDDRVRLTADTQQVLRLSLVDASTRDAIIVP